MEVTWIEVCVLLGMAHNFKRACKPEVLESVGHMRT
jgi:hypothetical protein